MGLFGANYENPGAGIAKDAPKKKGFFRFMEIFGRKFWKLLELNFLYMLFYLPLVAASFVYYRCAPGGLRYGLLAIFLLAFAVCFGPALAGHTKILRNFTLEKPVFMVHDFLKTFRSEFRYSCIVGLLDLLVAACIGSAFYIYPLLIQQSGSKIWYFFLVVALSVGVLAVMMNFYVFLMIVATNLPLKKILRNALALAFIAVKKNLLTLLFVGILGAGAGLILRYWIPGMILLLFLPASWMGLIICFNCYPIIQKYIINPYYEQRGEVNPELTGGTSSSEESVFEDMGGKEKPVEKKKTSSGRGKGKTIS